jgi:uncharacterized protein (DUF58 family)
MLTWPFVARSDPEEESMFAGSNDAFVSEAAAAGWIPKRLTSTANAILETPQYAGDRVLVLLSPDEPYAAVDADAIYQFVIEGGTLIVADAFDQSNSVLARFGAGLDRGRIVLPEDANVSFELDGRSYVAELGTPTGIHVSAGTTSRVLASTDNASFLDLDGNGVIDASDPQGPFPVVVELEPRDASGRLIIVADPTLLVRNGEDARAIRAALLGHASTSPGLLLIDESHAGSTSSFTQAMSTVTRAIFMLPARTAIMVVCAVLALLLLWPVPQDRWGPHRFLPERFITRSEADRPGLLDDALARSVTTQWTSAGYAAIAAGIGLLVAGLLFHNVQAEYGGGFLVLAACVATFTASPRVQAAVQLAEPKLQETRANECRLELRNLRRQAAHVEVRERLPGEFQVGRGEDWFEATIPGHGSVDCSFEFTPAVRGPHLLGPTQVRVYDPLRLRVSTQAVGAPIEAYVAPLLEPVRTLPFGTRVPMITMGPHLVNRAGEGMEFHSLRDYQLGDSIRIVNWKASARSKALVVNQRVHETMTHLTVILDARSVSGAGPADAAPIVRLSRAVVSLASALLRVRDRIRVYVYTDRLIETPPATGSRQLELLTDLLSTVRPSGNLPFEDVANQIAVRLSPKTPLLLATCAEGDPSIPAGLRQLTNMGILPFVIIAPIQVDGEDAKTEQERDQILDRREEILADIRGLGVPVHELRPGISLEFQFRMGGVA